MSKCLKSLMHKFVALRIHYWKKNLSSERVNITIYFIDKLVFMFRWNKAYKRKQCYNDLNNDNNNTLFTFILLNTLTLSFLSVLFLREKKTISFENASNLTHHFLYDNFNKKILQNLFVKVIIKNLFVKFDAFSRRNGSLFSSKTRCWKAKVLITY